MSEFSLDFQSNLLNLLQQSELSLNKLDTSFSDLSKTFSSLDKRFAYSFDENNKQALEFSDTSKKINKSFKELHDNLDKMKEITINEDGLKKANTELKKVTDYYNDIEEKSYKINNNMGILSKLVGGFSSIFGAVFGGFASLFSISTITDAINANKKYEQTFLDLSYRMGSAGKDFGTLRSSMHSIVKTTGIATEEAEELVASLAKYRVPAKQIADLGKTTAMFSEVTGVARGEASRLSGELMRTGRIGKDSTKLVLFGMASVQRAVGMTEEEMSNLSDNIVTNTRLLNNMGKSSSEIEKFAKTTTNLSGAFVKVGLSVQDAQDMLERFLDPTQFEDNALLFAQLGYSFSDVINGMVPQDELMSKLKGLGQQVKGMGMAGVELAKQLNIPYRQLMQMDEMEAAPLSGQEKEISEIEKTFKMMQEQQEGWGKNIEHTMNRVKDGLSQAFEKLTPMLSTITNKIEGFFSKIKLSSIAIFAGLGFVAFKFLKMMFNNLREGTSRASVDAQKKLSEGFTTPINRMRIGLARASVDTSNNLSKNIESGIEKGYKKPSVDMGKTIGSALSMNLTKSMKVLEQKREVRLRIIEEVRQARRERSDDFKKRQEKIEYLSAMQQTSLLGFSKKFNENTIAWLMTAQRGAKMYSGLAYQTEQLNKKTMERYELSTREANIVKYANSLRLEERGIELKTLNDRLAKLKELEASGEITTRQQRELKLVLDAQTKATESFNKMKQAANKEQERYDNQRLNLLKLTSVAELATLEEKMKANNQELKTQKDLLTNEIKALDNANKTLELGKVAAQMEIDKLQKRGQLNAEEAKKLLEHHAAIKNINALIEENNSSMAEFNLKNEEVSLKLKEQETALKEIAKAQEGRGEANIKEIKTDFMDKVNDYFKAVGTNLLGSLEKVRQNIVNSTISVAKNIGERLNPANIIAGLKDRGFKNILFGGEYKVMKANGEEQIKHTKGLIKTMGTAALAIGGVGAAMGIFNVILKPLNEMLRPFIETFANEFANAFKQLVPSILKMAIALIPLFTALVNTLMPTLFKVLGFVLNTASKIIDVIGNLIQTMVRLPTELGLIIGDFFGGASKKGLQKELDRLQDGSANRIKNAKEIEKIKELLNTGNEEEMRKELLNRKMQDSAVYKFGETIKGFAIQVSDAGKAATDAGKNFKAIETGDMVKSLEKAAEVASKPKAIITSPDTTPPTTQSQVQETITEKTPTVYAATNKGIKKTEDGKDVTKDTTAEEAANASKKTAEGVDKLHEGQAVQVDLQKLTYDELKKLNENFKNFFNKAVVSTPGVASNTRG